MGTSNLTLAGNIVERSGGDLLLWFTEPCCLQLRRAQKENWRVGGN